MEIRAIAPEMADDYLSLFDNAFTDNPHWAGCYCAFYDDPRPDEEWDTTQPGFAALNRESRRLRIERGEATGLLAFRRGRAVGWVNAGRRAEYGNLRVFAQAVDPTDPPIGSIMCFVIHPDHRGQGVATALLAGVDAYFRDLDLPVAEAYPRRRAPANPDFPWTAAFYKGTPEMYRKAGYLPHLEFESFVAMRKAL